MAKESSAAAISEESIAFLEDVKKGKPRRFAMICKGTNIVSLVVFKKGSIENRKKEAKEAGKGQFYFGVVDGKGPAIRFALARADGFDSEPVKNSVLKSFLDESAEIKCKPTFEIIDALPNVLDEDDPLVARFLKLQASAVIYTAAHPELANTINALCGKIQSNLNQSLSEAAAPDLDELEKMLSSSGDAKMETASPAAAASPESTTPPPAAPPPPPPTSDAAAKFLSRLKATKPTIDAAIADPNANPEIKRLFSEVAACGRSKEFDQANQKLDQVLALLNSPVRPTPPPTSSDDAASFTARLKLLKPQIEASIAAPGANPDIKVRFAEMVGFARQKQFEQANQALDELEAMIKQFAASPSSRDQAEERFKDLWQAAKSAWHLAIEQVDEQISQLQSALRISGDQGLQQIAEFGLNGITGNHKVRLMTVIQDIDSTGFGSLRKHAAKARNLVAAFQSHVESDEKVAAVDENPFGVSVNVRTTLTKAFEELNGAIDWALTKS